MEATASTMAVHRKMYAVTIPGSASSFARLSTLLEAAGFNKKLTNNLGVLIFPVSADYRVSSEAAGTPYYTVPTGDSYSEPAIELAEDTYVRAVGAGTISAVVSVYWKT